MGNIATNQLGGAGGLVNFPRHRQMPKAPLPMRKGDVPPPMPAPQAPATGLIGSEQAQQAGLASALGGLQEGFNQARGDIMAMLGTAGGAPRAGAFSNQGVGQAINQGVGALQGFANPGQQAMQSQAALSGALGADAQRRAFADYSASPEQAFIREEQERAVMRNAAATGGLGGGNVLEELQRRAAGRAAQDINNRFARLGQVSGQGLQAAGQIGQLRGQEAGLANALNIARGQAGTQANIAGAQNQLQRAMTGAQLLGGLGQQGGMTAADLAFRTGQSLGAGRTRAGEQIAGNISGTTSNLANLINQQGQGLSGIVGQQAGNLANLLQGFGLSQATGNEQLASLLANIATGSGSQVAGLPSLPGVQQTPGNLGGLGQLASGIGTMMRASDRRLKTDIKQIGETPSGIPWYSWRWKGSEVTDEGVMAQDMLEINPDAVILDETGYYKVNYGMVN